MPLEKKRTSRHQPIPGSGGGGGTSSSGYCNQKSAGYPERQRPSKCRSCCRKFTAFMFSHVGLCALVIGYSIMGAFAFRALESPYEVEKATQVIAMREKTVHRLWDITVEFNVLYKDNWTSTVGREIQEFQNKLIAAVKEGYDGKDHGSSQWSFSGAFLYSLTVITTIGYGNIAPKTSWGKIVTIVYAIAGIPLMLLYLTNIGDLLAKAFKYVYGHLCYCKSYNSGRRGRRAHHHLHHHHVAPPHEQYRIHHIVVHDAISNAHNSIDYVNKFAAAREEELKLESLGATANVGIAPGILHQEEELDYGKTRVTVPITLCLALITLYICGGAALFSLWEEWNYLDGYYFCFVTLSTIGFGDLVPGDTVVSDTGSQEKLVICSLYLLTGMALIAMCFNLVQEQVVFKIRNLGKRMGIVNDYEDPNE